MFNYNRIIFNCNIWYSYFVQILVSMCIVYSWLMHSRSVYNEIFQFSRELLNSLRIVLVQLQMGSSAAVLIV